MEGNVWQTSNAKVDTVNMDFVEEHRWVRPVQIMKIAMLNLPVKLKQLGHSPLRVKD